MSEAQLEAMAAAYVRAYCYAVARAAGSARVPRALALLARLLGRQRRELARIESANEFYRTEPAGPMLQCESQKPSVAKKPSE